METHVISELEIVPIKPRSGLVGFASFVYNQSIYLGSLGIYTKLGGGYRLAYPTRNSLGGCINIFYPINREIADYINNEVINKFEEVTKPYDRHNSISFK